MAVEALNEAHYLEKALAQGETRDPDLPAARLSAVWAKFQGNHAQLWVLLPNEKVDDAQEQLVKRSAFWGRSGRSRLSRRGGQRKCPLR